MPSGEHNAKLTDDQRTAILIKLEAGATCHALSKEYEVSPPTIYRLRDQASAVEAGVRVPAAARITAIKNNLASLVLAKMHDCYEAITPEKLLKSSAAQLAMIYGIFFDKYRLESGKSTVNNALTLQGVVEMSINPGGAASITTHASVKAPTPTPTPDATTPREPGAVDPHRPEAAATPVIDATVESVETQVDAVPLFPGVNGCEAIAGAGDAGDAGAAVLGDVVGVTEGLV